MAIDGDLLLKKSVVMRPVEHISHMTLLVSICFWMTLATVAHPLIELTIEEKCDKLWDYGDVPIDFHQLSIEAIMWFSAMWAHLQL